MFTKRLIKKYHRGSIPEWAFIYGVLVGVICGLAFGFDVRALMAGLLVWGVGYICFSLARLWDKEGLYVDGDEIYYCRGPFSKINIDINDIAAIKIERLQYRTKTLISFYKKGKNRYFYVLMLLNRTEKEMYDFDSGSIYFERRFPKSVIYYVLYDEELVTYLTDRKPDIEVMRYVQEKHMNAEVTEK